MRLLAILFPLIVVSCVEQLGLPHPPVDNPNASKPIKTVSVSNSFLKPSKLLANKDKYDGKDVKLLAYYIPHHDGDWITEVEGSYKESTISVPNTGRVNIELKDGSVVDHPSRLEWGNNGRPVIIEGRFKKDGVIHHMGMKMDNIAMIYRDRIVEIESSNNDWIELYR